MSKNKKSLNTIIVLLAIIATFSVTTYANAGFGYFGLNEEQRDVMERSLEDGDYNAWKNIQDSKTKLTDIISKDDFVKFSEMYNLVKDGKVNEAKKFGEELGLSKREGLIKSGDNIIDAVKTDMRELLESVRLSIENKDYSAWKEAVGDSKISETIQNEDDFNKLLEAHSLILDGRYDEAKAINDKLGVPSWVPSRNFENYGMHRKIADGKWFGRINQKVK